MRVDRDEELGSLVNVLGVRRKVIEWLKELQHSDVAAGKQDGYVSLALWVILSDQVLLRRCLDWWGQDAAGKEVYADLCRHFGVPCTRAILLLARWPTATTQGSPLGTPCGPDPDIISFFLRERRVALRCGVGGGRSGKTAIQGHAGRTGFVRWSVRCSGGSAFFPLHRS